MPVITYTAIDRGELVGGHSAGNSYQIEVDFEAFPRTTRARRDLDETLDGTPEGYLHALQHTYEVATDLVLLADRPNWREFFSSVLAGEEFEIDFAGTIAAPGTDIAVWLVDEQVTEQQIRGTGVKYRFTVKTHP